MLKMRQQFYRDTIYRFQKYLEKCLSMISLEPGIAFYVQGLFKKFFNNVRTRNSLKAVSVYEL